MSRVILNQFPAAWGLPNISPFCTKLETYLRMAGIPYEARPGNPRGSPTGKLPYVELDGHVFSDSQHIIEVLKARFGDKLDARLSPAERARGHLIRRTIEESTYFVLVYLRWQDDDGWRAYTPVFRSFLPPVLGRLLLPLIRRQVIKALHGQGTGRRSLDEITELGRADLDAVSTELGERPFLLGDAPSSFDAVLYAFTSGLLSFPADSALKRHLAATPNLVAHCQRMQERYFPASRPPGKS